MLIFSGNFFVTLWMNSFTKNKNEFSLYNYSYYVCVKNIYYLKESKQWACFAWWICFKNLYISFLYFTCWIVNIYYQKNHKIILWLCLVQIVKYALLNLALNIKFKTNWYLLWVCFFLFFLLQNGYTHNIK